MRRKITIIAAMAVIVSLISLGTLAFFTDSEEARNVITAGNIDIELHDLGGDEEPFPAEGLSGVMPGDSVDKIVFVENVGTQPAWVRVKLDKEIEGEGETELNFDNITLNLNLVDWTLQGDWYYYNFILEPGESTSHLFNVVHFGAALGNDYQNAVVTIDVLTEGVQSANNGATVTAAAGWPTP